MVLRVAIKSKLSNERFLKKKIRNYSGIVKTICLCLTFTEKDNTLAANCLAYLTPQDEQNLEWQ